MDACSEPNQLSEAAKRFLVSMTITYEMWHDGTGYDLQALKQVTNHELAEIERALIDHRPRDWRDIEALGEIDSPQAKQEIQAALKSSDVQVRQHAQECIGVALPREDRERLIIQSLDGDNLLDGLGAALDEVAEFHPPRVVEALFRGALRRPGEAAVNFAAMLFFLHGKATEPFDMKQRPFFLRFNTEIRHKRVEVFCEMCEQLGVDPAQYLRSGG